MDMRYSMHFKYVFEEGRTRDCIIAESCSDSGRTGHYFGYIEEEGDHGPIAWAVVHLKDDTNLTLRPTRDINLLSSSWQPLDTIREKRRLEREEEA